MNSLTTAPQGGKPARSSSAGRATAAVLQEAHRLEHPWRVMANLHAQHPAWFKAPISKQLPTIEDLRHPERPWAQDLVNRIKADAAPPEVIDQALEALLVLLAPTDRGQVLALLSVMVDGFPNARPHNPEAYVESLLHEVIAAGFSTGVIARATRETARTSKFPPSVAEFLETCKAADQTAGWLEALHKARQHAAELDRRIAEADRLGTLDAAGIAAADDIGF